MTPPHRWLDTRDASKDVLHLLEIARPPRPIDAATRARSRRRLSALMTVPAAAGAFFWLQSAALGALLGTALGGAVLVSERLTTKPAPSESAESPRAKRAASSASSQSIEPLQAPSARFPTADATAEIAEPPSPRQASAPSTGALATPDVAREARLLERARSLLATDPARSVRTLEQHAREFGTGTLHVEREFLWIEALVLLGRTMEARKRAQALALQAPGHLYEQRLRALLGAEF